MNPSFKLRKMILAAMFFALAYILPFLTGQIKEIGTMLCPMHVPVLICGFICGWSWGLAVGFAAPLFRSLTLGMPLLFPGAVCMAFELAVYGFTAGFLHKIFPKKKIFIYCSILISMTVGRIVWGLAMLICMGIRGTKFGFSAFISGSVTGSIPGIIIQLVIVPIIVMIIERSKIFKENSNFRK